MHFAALLLTAACLVSCSAHIDPARRPPPAASTTSLSWPKWKPLALTANIKSKKAELFPIAYQSSKGHVTSYGPGTDGREMFLVISKRDESPPQGITPLKTQFFPSSVFAGDNPMQTHFNYLDSSGNPPGKHYFFTAYPHRSTYFQCHPALTATDKGLIVYQTSVMLLSTVEARMVKRLQKRGWNVLVALPSDSLYRTRLPAYANDKENAAAAARYLAEDMDRHYAEQAYATRAALHYLKKTRPDWLAKKRVLIGTSAGAFTTPAVALQTPGWDAIVLVSAGTSLLDAYERGAARIFQNSLNWLAKSRHHPFKNVKRIPSDEEYHDLYRRAARQTRLNPGRLAPHLTDQRLLVIHGTIDRIIPRDQLEGLYQAIGQPERWTYPLGHHLVALQLLWDVPKLDRWLMKEPSHREALKTSVFAK